MSTAAFSRAPSQPGAEAEPSNPRSGASGAQSAGVPQGGHVPGHDPGLTHPHLVSRPMFYIHPAPPPPFLHYQWPMPFYSPFNPFSGLGYGMIMPPFPPAPYMEPPAYVFPHGPVQHVDYRRTVHPQPHPNSQTQTRRPRPPHPSLVRETVSCEVQTEPRERDYHGGSCSDSGRGTAPCSPTSSTSSNQKNSDGENRLETEGSQRLFSSTRVDDKPGLQTENPGERPSKQKMGEESSSVKSASLKSRSLQLVRQENVETVNTPHKDVGGKDRRISVPDILMSWGNSENVPQCPRTKAVSLFSQSPTVMNEDLLDGDMVDSDKAENEKMTDSKLHSGSCEQSLNSSVKVCSEGRDAINEQTLEEPSENVQTESGKLRRKLNESNWSVESIPVFVPTKEWLAQNITAGPEVLEEMEEEEEEKAAESDEMGNPKSRCNSSTDSIKMTDSFISFSTPASSVNKQARKTRSESIIHKLQKRTNPQDSPPCCKSSLTDRFKGKEKFELTKRQSLTVEEEQKKNRDSNKENTVLVETDKGSDKEKTILLEVNKKSRQESNKELVFVEVDKGSGEESSQKPCPTCGHGQRCGGERLSVPVHTVTQVSPSKMDCGVQCSELEINLKQLSKSEELQNASSRSEGFYGNGHKKRNFQFRSKGPERPYSQHETFQHHMDRPRKSRGGKCRY